MKKVFCPSCKQYKKPSEFNKNKSRKNGLQSHCKECFKKRYRNYNPLKKRMYHLKRYYNLNWETYKNWYELQEGKCAICGKEIKLIGEKNIKSGAHVDHDHESGEFRALLCHDCNAGLGYFQDNIELLKEATRYLEYFKHKK